MTRQTVDARGLLCPLPVIRTQNQARRMASGDEIEVLATDPGVRQDIPAWCRVHGHAIAEVSEADDEIRILITISPSAP